MEESSLIEKLLLFGLGRQEAGIYLCLLKNEPLTGYEVAKLTGISRSNVYNSLASLVDHGAAYVCEGPSTRYVAVVMEEFLDNRMRALEQEKRTLIENSPKKNVETEGYITVEGFTHISDKIHHMLEGTEKRVYFSADKEFLELWKNEIAELVAAGKKVVLICEDADQLFTEDQKLREGIIFYQSYSRQESEDEDEWNGQPVRLIIDSAYVLTGELKGTAQDTCLYSAQKNFVAVFKDALRNEIDLIKMYQK